jgi:hypothetical protein
MESMLLAWRSVRAFVDMGKETSSFVVDKMLAAPESVGHSADLRHA